MLGAGELIFPGSFFDMDTEKQTDRGRWWGAVVMLLVLAFFWPAFYRTFIFRDTFNLFYPYKAVAASYLRSLSICLWNPWETMGSSFVGELSPGWFYPGNVFFMIFPPEPALRIFIVSHYLLAALFTWLFLRDQDLSPEASAAGALAYTLSGYMVSQNGMPDMLASCTWLMGSLFFLGRWLKSRRRTWLLLLGASLAMPLLAGRAEGVIINAAAASGWILFSKRSGATTGARLKSLFTAMPLAGAVALLLSMVQILPSRELGKLSIKGGGFLLEVATLWSFHPRRLLEFLLPSPWGRFWPIQNYQGWDLTGWEGYYPWAVTEYMGVVVLLLAVLALARASWRTRVAVGSCLVLVVLFSMGSRGFLYELLYSLVPPFRIFRYPEKYMLLAVLIISISAAHGLDSLLRLVRDGIGRKLFLALACAGAASLFLALILHAGGDTLPDRPGPFGVESLDPAHFRHQFGRLMGALVPVILAIALARWEKTRTLTGPALVLAVFLDLMPANHWAVPYAPPGIYKFEPAALSIMRDHGRKQGLGLFTEDGSPRPGRFRVLREPMAPTEEAYVMLPGETRFERYRRFERHTLQPNFNFIHHIEGLTGYTAAATADFNELMKRHLNLKTMELYNVRYAISPAQGSVLERSDLPLAGAHYGFGFKVFEVPGAFPRAYLIGKSLRVDGSMERLELLGPHDFTKAVILENDPALPSPAEESDIGIVPAEIAFYSPHQVVINTSNPAAAYLVLSDSLYPGWEATVDGKPTPIFRANFLVRAVWTPGGDHVVEFTYRPGPYLFGRAISVLALLVFLAAAVEDIYRRRKSMPLPNDD